MIFNQTITRIRPGSRTDRSGDAVPVWATATSQPIRRVSVQPNAQAETVSADRDVTAERDQRITSYRVYTRPGADADVLATDRIKWAGTTFEVAGEVARWPHPTRPGRVHHVEFTIREVEG